jgi:hypothetical protein
VRLNMSTVRITPKNQVPAIWRCTYKYCFSDSSFSIDLTEDTGSPCTVNGPICIN